MIYSAHGCSIAKVTTYKTQFVRSSLQEFRSPERDAPWAKRIIREPAVSELSRDWPEAWAARAKLLQLRAPAGERLPPG